MNLHDFFLYYILRFGYEPAKIYRIAKKAFEGVYEKKTILKMAQDILPQIFFTAV